MPAAQEVIESRRSHCFFTMSSSNRCDRTSAAEDQATASSSNQRQEFRDSQYDDEERHRSPSGGYARRKREELPPRSKRTWDTLPYEDHMAFSECFRYETEWFQAHERVRKKRARGMHAVMGPNNMTGFDRHQMCMDVISWILEGDSKKREYDEAIYWLAEFLKYLLGYAAQEEEDWFDAECSRFYIDLTGPRKSRNFISCSKALSAILRHEKKAYLFSPSGSMNIADVFDQLEGNNPKRRGLSGAQFAALLLCNNRQGFFVEIYMQWEWYPFSAAATYPVLSMFDLDALKGT